MVLGGLLGQGDAEYAAEVPVPLLPERVMFAGLGRLSAQEAGLIERLGIRQASPADLAHDSAAVVDWITQTGIDHLAIHLDLDVLDPAQFRGQGFAKPGQDASALRAGSMRFAEVIRLIADVSARTDVVALGNTEHLPWDVVNLRDMLRQFPILIG
jgi:arginase